MSRIELRGATADDAELVHTWANDPVTRAASFSSAEIPLADHLAWFGRQLAAAGHHLLIAETEAGAPFAFVRLDTREQAEDRCTISINLDPAVRGQGLGTATLEAASCWAAGAGLRFIDALIRPTNRASVRAFEKAGYVHASETEVQGQPALHLIRSLTDLP